jgi:hypothetical protein
MMAGTQWVGVIVSDSMMFQRADPTPSDANLGSFYGLSLPLIMSGMPVEPVQLESVTADKFLSRYKLLLLTFEGQKPLKPAYNEALARWVRGGGALLVVDDDQDPYLAVREWWNTAPNSYRTPREHLFKMLGLQPEQTGLRKVGRGAVVYEKSSPAALSYGSDGAAKVKKLVEQVAAAVHLPWKDSPALVLKRGPYVVAAALKEEVKLPGRYVNLFDDTLAVHDGFTLSTGGRALLYEIPEASHPVIVAAAARIGNLTWNDEVMRFTADGQANTGAIVCIASKTPPKTISVNQEALPLSKLRSQSGSFVFSFENKAEPQSIEIRF